MTEPRRYMIDVNQEQLVPIRNVPGLLPRRPTGKRVHISAVYRWVQRGVRGVRLESIRIGGTTYTSREALQRFAERHDHPSSARREQDRPTPRARRNEIEKAAKAVERQLGISTSDSEDHGP